MAVDGLARAVRERLSLGRLLPLGDAAGGVWIAERAAAGVLRAAADTAVPDARLDTVRIGLARWENAAPTNPAAPPSALPPGPLRIEAEFAATADRPFPRTADALRAALTDSAGRHLGLTVDAIDLRVAGVLGADGRRDGGRNAEGAAARNGEREAERSGEPEVERSAEGAAERSGKREAARDTAAAATAQLSAVALSVPGVSRLTSRLTGLIAGPRVADLPERGLRTVQLQLGVDRGHRALDVALTVRAAVTAAAAVGAPGEVVTAVVVTDID